MSKWVTVTDKGSTNIGRNILGLDEDLCDEIDEFEDDEESEENTVADVEYEPLVKLTYEKNVNIDEIPNLSVRHDMLWGSNAPKRRRLDRNEDTEIDIQQSIHQSNAIGDSTHLFQSEMRLEESIGQFSQNTPAHLENSVDDENAGIVNEEGRPEWVMNQMSQVINNDTNFYQFANPESYSYQLRGLRMLRKHKHRNRKDCVVCQLLSSPQGNYEFTMARCRCVLNETDIQVPEQFILVASRNIGDIMHAETFNVHKPFKMAESRQNGEHYLISYILST